MTLAAMAEGPSPWLTPEPGPTIPGMDEDRLREPLPDRQRAADERAIQEGRKGVYVMPTTPQESIDVSDFVDGMPDPGLSTGGLTPSASPAPQSPTAPADPEK
jgi:hypothetical protein